MAEIRMIRVLEELPSAKDTNVPNKATAEPRWIPVSERLPDYPKTIEETYILATLKYGESHYVKEILREEAVPPYGQYSKSCIAWMPLPQPWKGEEDET